MKSVVGGVTTTFVGTHYQITGGTVTKYYFAGASRIAMRTGSTLTYLLGNHLGSTSLTTDSAGTKVSEMRYKPWGETRYSSGTTATSYKYTGQREEPSFGLYFYNARWMDPVTGRFVQADSLVPGGVQGLDRYAYVRNSPLVYNDPSGHLEASKVKKLLGIEGLTGKALNAWLDLNSNRTLWDKLLGAKVGDMLSFMIVANGENVYQRYIIGEDQNGDYVFWGLDNNPGEQCETTCYEATPTPHAEASRDEALAHLSSGHEWGFYSLDSNTTNKFKYTFQGRSDYFTSPTAEIVLEPGGWTQHGNEFLIFSYQTNPIVGAIGILGIAGGCYLSNALACGAAVITSTWAIVETFTISDASYIDHSLISRQQYPQCSRGGCK